MWFPAYILTCKRTILTFFFFVHFFFVFGGSNQTSACFVGDIYILSESSQTSVRKVGIFQSQRKLVFRGVKPGIQGNILRFKSSHIPGTCYFSNPKNSILGNPKNILKSLEIWDPMYSFIPVNDCP